MGQLYMCREIFFGIYETVEFFYGNLDIGVVTRFVWFLIQYQREKNPREGYIFHLCGLSSAVAPFQHQWDLFLIRKQTVLPKLIQLDNLLVVVVVVVHPEELWPSRQGLAAKPALHLLLSPSAGSCVGLLISILGNRVCALISLSGKRVVPLLISPNGNKVGPLISRTGNRMGFLISPTDNMVGLISPTSNREVSKALIYILLHWLDSCVSGWGCTDLYVGSGRAVF